MCDVRDPTISLFMPELYLFNCDVVQNILDLDRIRLLIQVHTDHTMAELANFSSRIELFSQSTNILVWNPLNKCISSCRKRLPKYSYRRGDSYAEGEGTNQNMMDEVERNIVVDEMGKRIELDEIVTADMVLLLFGFVEQL